MPRPLVPWPHPVLKSKAKPVEAITPDVLSLWQEMIEVMEAMPGYGLAAPQLGVSLCLAVVDCSTERGQAVRLANPTLLEASNDLYWWTEASPNLPGLSAKLARPRSVRVRYLDETGTETERLFEDLWSTSVQHQMDHLGGRMYFDNLSRTKRAMLLKKHAKAKG